MRAGGGEGAHVQGSPAAPPTHAPLLAAPIQVKAKFDPDGFFNTNPVAIPAAATNRQQPATAPQ